MRRREMYAYLEKVPFFAGLSQKQLAAVARVVDEIDIAAGTDLITEGSGGSEMFIIVSGGAVVTRGGRRRATLGPGDVVGETSVIDHHPRSATVKMTEDSTVLVVSGRAFKPLLSDVPKLAEKILTDLAARVREAESHHI